MISFTSFQALKVLGSSAAYTVKPLLYMVNQQALKIMQHSAVTLESARWLIPFAISFSKPIFAFVLNNCLFFWLSRRLLSRVPREQNSRTKSTGPI